MGKTHRSSLRLPYRVEAVRSNAWLIFGNSLVGFNGNLFHWTYFPGLKQMEVKL